MYLKAETENGFNPAYLPFEIAVCGEEIFEPVDSSTSFIIDVYQIQTKFTLNNATILG